MKSGELPVYPPKCGCSYRFILPKMGVGAAETNWTSDLRLHRSQHKYKHKLTSEGVYVGR
eukprot:scaffold99129_cov31-Tisochrysis_lutea.AAC.3